MMEGILEELKGFGMHKDPGEQGGNKNKRENKEKYKRGHREFVSANNLGADQIIKVN